MEIRQLRYFLAIADAGTFTAAAERLRISQPGLSASIRALEHRLGTALLVRGRKRVELTEAGRELYVGARRALAALEATESQIRCGPGVTKSTLPVGAIPSFAGLDLAALISRFTAENPHVDVDVTGGMPLDLFAKLTDRTIELAFVTMPPQAPPGIRLTPLSTYPMVLACPLGHRLAGRRSVELAALRDETFVDFPADLVARQVTDQAFQAAGISRNVRVTCNEIGSLLELVAHGLGIAIVPRPLAIATRVPTALVPLDNASLVCTVAVATPAHGVATDAAQAMWNLISNTALPVVHR
ncbi:LysR family transcriptional regulator [Streptomyces sp. NPDC050161]|uniref:LysR family transcriptional regulator n=1 Tax=Streptomyces sp. NPDC050161 TaxID=3365604 RepID=UPI00379B8660